MIPVFGDPPIVNVLAAEAAAALSQYTQAVTARVTFGANQLSISMFPARVGTSNPTSL